MNLRKLKSALPDVVKDRLRSLVPNYAWNYLRAYTEPLKLYETDRFTFYPISREPPVIYTMAGKSLGNVFYMAEELDDRPASFIIAFHKHVSDWKARFIRRQFKVFKDKYNQHQLVVLGPDKKESDKLKSIIKCKVKFINKNAFTRENKFVIKNDVKKRFASVMNAAMMRVKRVELAKDINNIAIVTSIREDDYYKEMRGLMNHADWVNFSDGKYEYMSRKEVCEVLNAARTGLILSAVEGTNRASIEYLLCGLPVVSTPSRGGRDVFFDEEYCAIVEPNPEAVRDGVQRMIDRDIEPTYVRDKTLERIRDHRERFLNLANELAGSDLGIDVGDWLDHFPRDLEFNCHPDNFADLLENTRFGGEATESSNIG